MIPNNSLAFIALSNEYCQALENAYQTEKGEFVDAMLRLLPRLYISAMDIQAESMYGDSAYLPGALEEDYYESIRRTIETLMGEDDTYLEVFEEDMKYSDTPITASVSEELADIFQVLYNFIENVKDAPEEIIEQSVETVHEEFGAYWSQNLCNVLRALNAIKFSF